MPSLSLGLHLVQIQECILCNQSVENHAAECLYRLLEQAVSMRRYITCACCYSRSVELNKDDFYECQNCRRQFCTGEIVPGKPGPLVVLIDYERNTTIAATQLRCKGKGKFKYKILTRNLDDRIRIAVKIAMNKSKAQKALERSSHWLAESNAANEKGNPHKANLCYSKSQFWLDRYNKLSGESRQFPSDV